MEHRVKHIDEGTLHAWLDGALGSEDAARVESHVASCATCGAAAAEARGLVAAASRILTALDDVPGGVAPGGYGAGRPFSASRRRWTGWPLRAAAAVIFVVAGSFAVIQRMGMSNLADRVTETPQAAFAPAPATPPVPAGAPAPRADSTTAPFAAIQEAAKQEPEKKQQPALKSQLARKRQVGPPAEVPGGLTPTTPPAAPPTIAQATEGLQARTVPRTVTIAGRVVSAETGEPIPQAVVHLNNPSVTSATNANGDYAIPVPTSQAANAPVTLTVRRIGFASTLDSVTVARNAPADTVRRDIKMAPDNVHLDQVVVTGIGTRDAARATAKVYSGAATARGCYALDEPGLPARIELGARLRVMPPDSAAFPTAVWTLDDPNKVVIVLSDTAGIIRDISATPAVDGLRGHITRSDSASVPPRPIFAKRTGAQCQ